MISRICDFARLYEKVREVSYNSIFEFIKVGSNHSFFKVTGHDGVRGGSGAGHKTWSWG